MSTDPDSFYDMVVALGAIFMTVALPIWLAFRYAGQKAAARTRGADPAAATEMMDRARRLESRIEYLERVLDAEMPGWRTRS